VDIIRYGPSCAPSVLILFINMMLFKSSPPTGKGCEEFMFDGQDILQYVFVILALLCIPVLLLGKPIYILCGGGKKSSDNVSAFHVKDVQWWMLNIVHVFHPGIIIFNIILEHIDAVTSSHTFKNIVVMESGTLHLQPFTSFIIVESVTSRVLFPH